MKQVDLLLHRLGNAIHHQARLFVEHFQVFDLLNSASFLQRRSDMRVDSIVQLAHRDSYHRKIFSWPRAAPDSPLA